MDSHNCDLSWLPNLVRLEDWGGEWQPFLEHIYSLFRHDFIETAPIWPRKRVGLKRHPISKGKEATFWHFIQEGAMEDERTPCLHRCARIQWPRALIDVFPDRKPISSDPIKWWKNRRGSNAFFVISLVDFSYLHVIADRGEYVLPWTAYCVERNHQRRKLWKEYELYWDNKG
ncbi:MAG TPA: hypothetical protein PK991_07730 [Candidatus Sabulitectum sp.]|nr:hypothetical protein [Candidatus Sabulitectum sp.]